MLPYKTEQRKKLIKFFSEHADECFSASQIEKEFSSSEISISAVYRNLSSLENEGYIKRVAKNGCREIFFRSVCSDECRKCIHLTCLVCGSTYHLANSASEKILEAVDLSDGFEISKNSTVLYGVCKKCR